MCRRRAAVLAFPAWLCAVAAGSLAFADAQGPTPFCPAGGASDSALPDPSRVAAVRLDSGGERRSFRYAFDPGGVEATAALVGLSHEYTCHIARDEAVTRPELARSYCALGNFEDVLDGLARDGLNVLRLYGVFNHGLGAAFGESGPYPFEQPFVRLPGRWDLSRIESAYLDRLERVVRAAYCRRLVVELTLLDPWDGDFATGPFAERNALPGQGLREKGDFLRRGNRAEPFQKAAVTAIVDRLRRYPNLIWEVANEPDLAPDGIAVDEIAAFERRVIEEWILPLDDAHLVMVNGHQEGAFGWELPRVSVASAHYAEIGDRRAGALELPGAPGAAAARPRVALAFNEGKALGAGTEVDASDVRTEAWEFLFAGGSLFDAYSVDRTSSAAREAARELGVLARVFRSEGPFFSDLTTLRPARCGDEGWCDGVPAPDAAAARCPAGAATRVTALESGDRLELGLYLRRALTVGTPGAAQGVFRRLDAQRCGPLEAPGFVFRPPTGGCWRLRWIDPADGGERSGRTVDVRAGADVPFPDRSGGEASDRAFFARRLGDRCPVPPAGATGPGGDVPAAAGSTPAGS